MVVLLRHCKVKHFVVMGVAGCGKSTIASLLAQRLNGKMVEADALHGASNIQKMESGEALTDDDRWPWLARVANAMAETPTPVFVSCSALRRAYRQSLSDNAGLSVGFIHLHAEQEVIAKRMSARQGHFMPESLLDSQYQTLEPLCDDELGVVIDIRQPIDAVVEDALVFIKQYKD